MNLQISYAIEAMRPNDEFANTVAIDPARSNKTAIFFVYKKCCLLYNNHSSHT